MNELTVLSQTPFKPSVRRVRQILEKHGVQYCRAARKPLLTQRHMDNRCRVVKILKSIDCSSNRLAFAQKYLAKSFDRVVFSDEKMFRFKPGDKVGVWRRRGESRLRASYTVKTTTKSEGVMVWAAINSSGQVIVRQCPKKVKATDYQDILSESLSFIRGGRYSHPHVIAIAATCCLQGNPQEGGLPAGRCPHTQGCFHYEMVAAEGGNHAEQRGLACTKPRP